MDFEQLQGLLDKFSEVGQLSLRIVDLVSCVSVLHLVQVEDWQDLSVVWD